MAKDINLTSQEWCDIVFEEKNKKYGAYKIRRMSSRRHTIALIVVFVFAIFIAFLPFLIKTVVEATRPASEGLTESTVLAELKNVEDQVKEENIAHQQEAPPPPPLKSTIKFTPPVITATEEMKEDDGMKSQEELAETKLQISVADVKGTDDQHGVDIADLKEHKVIVQQEKEEVFVSVEQMPEFPGGEGELRTFIQKNLKYPAIAKENRIVGRVYIEFVVNKNGEIDRIKILRSPHGSLSEEAIRVIKIMPKWVPGKQNGISVSTRINMPIIFELR